MRLKILPRSREDSRIINEILQDSKYEFEYDSVIGYFSIDVAPEDADDMEEDVMELFQEVTVKSF